MAIGHYDDDRGWWWRDGNDPPRIKVTCAVLRDFEDLDSYSVKPGSLNATINMLIKVYNDIPEEYRDQAYIQVHSYEHSESVCGQVFYVRDITPEEKIEEEAGNEEYERKEVEKEKRQYEILKAKYG